MALKPKTAAAAATTDENHQPAEDAGDKKEAPAPAPAAAPAPAEQPVEDKAASVSRVDAAAIAEYCAANGCAQMAAELIKSGASLEDAKAKVGAAAEIKKLVADARKVNAAIDPKLADEFIKSGASLEHVRKTLLETLVSSQSDEIKGQHSNPGSEATARAGWATAVSKLSKK